MMASVLDSELFVSKDCILLIFVSLVQYLVNSRAQKTFFWFYEWFKKTWGSLIFKIMCKVTHEHGSVPVPLCPMFATLQ